MEQLWVFFLFYWYIHQVQSLRSHFLLFSHAIISCNISFNLLHYWYFIFSEGMITLWLPLYMRIIYEYVLIEIKLLCIIANYYFFFVCIIPKPPSTINDAILSEYLAYRSNLTGTNLKGYQCNIRQWCSDSFDTIFISNIRDSKEGWSRTLFYSIS